MAAFPAGNDVLATCDTSCHMSESPKGVEVKQRFVDDAELTELVFTLEKSTQIKAVFAPESLASRFRKVFKKEIQTGDGIFDEAVNIRTDTTDATTALLESVDVRAPIENLILAGGVVEIDGITVKIELPGQRSADDELAVNVVKALGA